MLNHLKLPWDRADKQPHGKAVHVSVLVDEYLKSQKYNGISLGSKMRYQSALKLFDHLVMANNKTLYQMYAHKVDFGVVDYLHAVLAHTHSAATIRLCFSIMQNVWDVALRNGRVIYNPWARNGVKVDNERDVTWTHEQVNASVLKAKELGYNILALYILFGYETGIRMWSDLRRLTYEMIHTDDKGGVVLEFTIAKTNVHLCLPLSNVIVDALKETGRTTGLIFMDDKGRLLTQGCFFRQFRAVKTAAMLPMHLQLRDLRRTAVTELVTSGATDREIAAITGWKNPGSVINRYARIRLQSAENGMNKRWASREQIPQVGGES